MNRPLEREQTEIPLRPLFAATGTGTGDDHYVIYKCPFWARVKPKTGRKTDDKSHFPPNCTSKEPCNLALCAAMHWGGPLYSYGSKMCAIIRAKVCRMKTHVCVCVLVTNRWSRVLCHVFVCVHLLRTIRLSLDWLTRRDEYRPHPQRRLHTFCAVHARAQSCPCHGCEYAVNMLSTRAYAHWRHVRPFLLFGTVWAAASAACNLVREAINSVYHLWYNHYRCLKLLLPWNQRQLNWKFEHTYLYMLLLYNNVCISRVEYSNTKTDYIYNKPSNARYFWPICLLQ